MDIKTQEKHFLQAGTFMKHKASNLMMNDF